MSHAVVYYENGTKLTGPYDGYGRIDPNATEILDEGSPFSVYHEACWISNGQPGFTGASKSDVDQGYFFNDDDPAYNSPKPSS